MENSPPHHLLKMAPAALTSLANRLRREAAASRFELCSIINAKSGLCSQDCKFCAQASRHRAQVDSWPLKDKNEIVTAAARAKEIGAQRFGIVTSGRRASAAELARIAQAISEIRAKVGISLCASLGALNKNELKMLKEAGLTRYHHNLESSPRFYPQIVSTHSFSERVNTVRAAQQAGLSVCSGGIIGMGETWQDRIDLAQLLKELDVDSIPLNFLVPIKGTPLAGLEPITGEDALRSVAIFRVILKDKIIKIAAGRETIFRDSPASGFLAGANGMLIGGYLTLRGRAVAEDHKLIQEIKRLWKESKDS